MHYIDRRQAYIECELRGCVETSPVFVPKVGGEVPEGWVVSTAVASVVMARFADRARIIDP